MDQRIKVNFKGLLDCLGVHFYSARIKYEGHWKDNK